VNYIISCNIVIIFRLNGHGQTYNNYVDTLNSSFNIICVIMLISFLITIINLDNKLSDVTIFIMNLTF